MSAEQVPATPAADLDAADLVVLSHLPWTWVWQRPQHLVSRRGRDRRTWFVEPPVCAPVSGPTLRTEPAGPVTRVWIELPLGTPLQAWSTPQVAGAGELIGDLLGGAPRDVWLYAPNAVGVAEQLEPRLLVHDVMDDLASFADTPPEMVLRVRRPQTRADVVVMGGRSLHAVATAVRGADCLADRSVAQVAT